MDLYFFTDPGLWSIKHISGPPAPKMHRSGTASSALIERALAQRDAAPGGMREVSNGRGAKPSAPCCKIMREARSKCLGRRGLPPLVFAAWAYRAAPAERGGNNQALWHGRRRMSRCFLGPVLASARRSAS